MAALPCPAPSAPAPMAGLTRRSEFLAAARGPQAGTPGFVLQGRARWTDEPAPDTAVRFGVTCSKKVGNAVARNRAKRRLREIARAVLPTHGRPGWDYVLIGRPGETATRPFSTLLADLHSALDRVHAGGERRRRR